MSGPLAIVVATAAAMPPPPPPLLDAISLSIPSTDGARGAEVSYERWLPERRLSLAVAGELRESAIGDYTGIRVGASARVRWYWRADAWLSRLPAGHMVGWFVGGAIHAGGDFTHDDVDRRWLGSALELGASGQLGYRIAPWRQLVITPSAGLEAHRDVDLSGRLPGWTRGGLTVGLEVGWLF